MKLPSERSLALIGWRAGPDGCAAVASACLLVAPGVEVSGEWRECGEQYRGGKQYPGELAGDRVAGQQAASGGDQVRDRVDPDEDLEPPGHGPRLDERGPRPGQAVCEGQ